MPETKNYRLEIVNRYIGEDCVSGLLYDPSDTNNTTYRETRVYDLSLGGDQQAAQTFAHRVLADEHAQEVHVSGAEKSEPALSGHTYFIDIYMKSNVLDLEKNMISKLEPQVENLTIRRRIYVTGDVPPERLVRDLVNPVIQESDVVQA